MALLGFSSRQLPARSSHRFPTVSTIAILGVLLFGFPGGIAAQGRISGRVLDREQGTPIAAAVVRVAAGPDTASATTDAQGRYSLTLPGGGGAITVRAERLGYLPLSAVIPRDEVTAGVVWRDLRLAPRAVEVAGVTAARRRIRQEVPPRAPGGNDETRESWLQTNFALDPGDLAALAGQQPGVQAAEGGISFFAQDPSQTSTTLDGARFGASSLPQEAIGSTSVTGSTYDPARGQFSGGLVAASTLSGSNLFGGAFRTRWSPTQLQWRGSGAERPGTSLASGDAGAGGALVPGRLYWFGAASATRRLTPVVALENAGAVLLDGLGVDPDSAARLAGLLRDVGLSRAGAGGTDGKSESMSGILRLDADLAAGHELMVRADVRSLRIGGIGVSPLVSLSSGGRARDEGAGLLARLASRIGAVDNELTASWSGARREFGAGGGPGGMVRVTAADDSGGSATLRFGGALADAGTRGSLVELASQATVDAGRGHEPRAGFLFAAERSTVTSAANRFGTFTFETLDDFRMRIPSLFTRTLGESRGEATARHAAVYAGDVWRRGRLGLTVGARLETRWYPAGSGSPTPQTLPFGVRTGRIPSERGVSPRFGWSYFGDGWEVYGGAGEFRGSPPLEAAAQALGEDGGPGEISLVCVGAEAPTPDWEGYAESPERIPAACRGNAPAFASRTPILTYFADDFTAPRTWRGSLGGRVPLPARTRLTFDLLYARGMGQPVARDRNVDLAPDFALPGEGGRPVYASMEAIDPGTGGVAPGSGRLLPAWGAVREIGADGRSSVFQARADLTLFAGAAVRARMPRVSGSYVFTRARGEVGTLPSLFGGSAYAVAPDALTGGPADLERRHALQLRLIYSPIRWARLGLLGQLTSGAPFTPRVDGDVNGDDARNDPAFVFDPARTADRSVADGMARLLEHAPGRVSDCLRAQLGRVAGYNSCRAGWSSSLDLRTEFQFWRAGVTRRGRLTVTTSNLLGVIDRAVHGGDGRGWGAPPRVDPVLLRVRGFDPAGPAFDYEVNPGFGARRPVAGLLRPFALTIEGRITVGSDPAFQSLQRLVNRSMGAGRSVDELRQALSQRVPNLPAQVISLDSAGALGLSAEQRGRLAARADSLGGIVAPLADSLAAALHAVETRRGNPRNAQRQVQALLRRIRAALAAELDGMRAVLTDEQWRRLPPAIREPDQQLLPRTEFASPVQVGAG
jgi:hypothetical protein